MSTLIKYFQTDKPEEDVDIVLNLRRSIKVCSLFIKDWYQRAATGPFKLKAQPH